MAVLPFHEFCKSALNLVPEPGQEVLARLAFGDEQVTDLPLELQPLAEKMLGGRFIIAKEHRKLIALSLGRGSGKTTFCSAFGLYQLFTADLSRCGPGDKAVVFIIAPDKPTAKMSVAMAREMLRSNKRLNALVVAEDKESITIRRPQDGRLVVFEAKAANMGGASARGRSIICFILDEAEFFSSSGAEEDYIVNAGAIVGAMMPRLLPDGKGLLISTPWPTENIMAEMIEKNFGHPIDSLAIIAPTTLVRIGPEIEKLVAAEMKRDAENARREFFCERDAFVGGKFFDAPSINLCSEEYELPLPRAWVNRYVAAGDFAFTRDNASLVITQWDGKRYSIASMIELSPEKGKPLRPSEVVATFALEMKRYGITSIICDGHYRESIREHLETHGIVLLHAPEGAKGKHAVYSRTKAVMREGLCCIPKDKRFRNQLLAVQARPSAGGEIQIRSPRRMGSGHGDSVSAWVLCIHEMSYSTIGKEVSSLEPGSPGWNEEFNRRVAVKDQRRESDYVKKLEQAAKRQQKFKPWGTN